MQCKTMQCNGTARSSRLVVRVCSQKPPMSGTMSLPSAGNSSVFPFSNRTRTLASSIVRKGGGSTTVPFPRFMWTTRTPTGKNHVGSTPMSLGGDRDDDRGGGLLLLLLLLLLLALLLKLLPRRALGWAFPCTCLGGADRGGGLRRLGGTPAPADEGDDSVDRSASTRSTLGREDFGREALEEVVRFRGRIGGSIRRDDDDDDDDIARRAAWGDLRASAPFSPVRFTYRLLLLPTAGLRPAALPLREVDLDAFRNAMRVLDWAPFGFRFASLARDFFDTMAFRKRLRCFELVFGPSVFHLEKLVSSLRQVRTSLVFARVMAT
mmetsp:Transcript_6627/g.19072  ORF Transcript_6627/g.19072 Transcript_6627/m.19072 type:complete len:322 (-) Transcript_6627:3220-4185(-)